MSCSATADNTQTGHVSRCFSFCDCISYADTLLQPQTWFPASLDFIMIFLGLMRKVNFEFTQTTIVDSKFGTILDLSRVQNNAFAQVFCLKT
jgi:hypothetical protein